MSDTLGRFLLARAYESTPIRALAEPAVVQRIAPVVQRIVSACMDVTEAARGSEPVPDASQAKGMA